MAANVILVGWGLWVSACGLDSCDAMAVTETIFTQKECETRKLYLEKKRPELYFHCGEIYRENNQSIFDKENKQSPSINPQINKNYKNN